MRSDRYLKIVLTLIAVELLWIALRDAAPRASAQAPPARVVIAGIEVDPRDGGLLPVVVAGQVGGAFRTGLESIRVRVSDSVPIDVRSPLKVEVGQPLSVVAERPLPVEAVPYRPSPRPGG
jgi:hypothetical protein